jgi:hypothetical protein
MAQGQNIDDYGGYMVLNENNIIVDGERFDLTLDDLEEWVAGD